MMPTDSDRKAAYAAEDQLASWVDAVTPERPTVVVDGRAYRPEVEPRFTDPASAAAYVAQVLDHLRATGRQYDGWEHRPVTVRVRRGAQMAHYEPGTGTIALPTFEAGGRWALRGLVVLHELAHHLCGGEPGHGPRWRATLLRLLEDLGCPVLAELLHLAYAGEGLEQLGHTVDDGTLARIARLLRQAERAGNDHERDAFLGKAQGLATRHSVALAVARAHTARQERREQPVEERYRIGPRGKRGLARYVRLLLNVAHANDLRCTISHDSTAVTLHGFPSDIAVTKALYESLLVQMVADCERYLASDERDQRERWDPRRRRYVLEPVATITARLAFYEAFGMRIGERLLAARAEALAEMGVEESDPDGPVSDETALALRQKELDVHDFFQEALRRNQVRGTWSGDRRSSLRDAPTAASEGVRAAERARISDAQVLDEVG